MQTSYFAKSSRHPNAVSIAGRCPREFSGREYKTLAPRYWFFAKYKRDHDEKFYTEQYQKLILNFLDPKKVFEELGADAVLLCWEKPGVFCHRRLVAEWLEKSLGIEIPEFT
jgi:uncharacterized protein (DUF488 family)